MSYIVIMGSTFFWHTIRHDHLFFLSKSHPWSISPWPIYYIFKYRRKLTKSLRLNVLQYDDAALKNWQHEGQHMSDLDNARISSYESLHGQTIWNKRTRRSFARLSIVAILFFRKQIDWMFSRATGLVFSAELFARFIFSPFLLYLEKKKEKIRRSAKKNKHLDRWLKAFAGKTCVREWTAL